MLFLLILILSFAASFFLPWWVAAVFAFLAAFTMGKTSVRCFWSGFAAVFTAWAVIALFKSTRNDNILADRVAHLFQLPNWTWILLVTALVGGLVGGMAAFSGILLKKVFEN